MQDFVHLHVHTQYSLLDGQASVARLVDKAMKNQRKSLDSFMQSYGIIGITLWRNDSVSTGKRQYPYLETVVSRLRNSRFLPWKL